MMRQCRDVTYNRGMGGSTYDWIPSLANLLNFSCGTFFIIEVASLLEIGGGNTFHKNQVKSVPM